MVKMLASKTVLYKGVIHYAQTPFEVDEADYESFILAGYHTFKEEALPVEVSELIADPQEVSLVASEESDVEQISEEELAKEEELDAKRSLLVELTKEELRETCDTYLIKYKAADTKSVLTDLIINALSIEVIEGVVDLFRGDASRE